MKCPSGLAREARNVHKLAAIVKPYARQLLQDDTRRQRFGVLLRHITPSRNGMSQKKSKKKSAGSDPHRQREQAKYDAPIASREFITSVLASDKGPMDIEALAVELGLTGNADAEEALRRRVGAMIRDGQLIQNRKRGLVPVDTDALIAGRISAHPDGFGFVIADDGDKDIYLNGKQMRQVLHGDRVVVCVTGIDHRGRREGRIVDVVERANKSLVGRLSIDRGTAVVLPDNKRIHQDLLIAPGTLEGANDGDMVVAEIVEQPTRRHQPVGRIVEVLGQHLKAGMEIDVALHSHGIPVEWPDAVTDQAAAFSTVVDDSMAKDRKDVRDLPLITIDGIDARDFDDAVWCEPLASGWRLMVAIADVANYVSAGSALDDEAIERGTSVYFPGRVVPMLPEVLSNGLCSLNPEVDRLCMICEMTLDENANVKKTRFHNGIMRSHARLTYDQVGEMLSDSQSSLRDQHAPLMPMIDEMYRLYKALAAKRRERGAIEFDSNETHIIFDDNKKIKEIIPIQRNDAHKLIEECMILANIQAAAYLEEQEIPALYRVHAGPKSDRLIDLRAFLALRGLTLSGGDLPSAVDYAALAEQISERTDRSVIQTVMLRSMQQAVYQPKNEGHFGLALDQYAHFTSPIRRYPDLLVHRAIKHALKRGKPVDYRYSKEAMQVLGESCSMTERRAEEASRDVVSWLKCEYMQEHVGSEFPGVITAVTSFGLFVELVGIHVEGLVHITNLSRDYYRFEQAAHALTGERTGKQYHLGDAIVVRVAAVNLEERKIDFSEVEQGEHQARQPAKEKHRSKKTHKHSQHRNKQPQEEKQVPVQEPLVANDAHGLPKHADEAAEKRRLKNRRKKQRSREIKKAARKEARRLESLQKNSQSAQASTVDSAPASSVDSEQQSQSGKQAKKRQKRRDVEKVAGIAQGGSEQVGQSGNKPGKQPSGKMTSKTTQPQATVKVASKVASQAAGKANNKATGKVASKVSSKAANQAKGKANSKATGKVASKVSSKVASQAAGKAKSKASGKVASKVSSKVASQAVGKAKSKASGKVASKVSSKVASQAAGKSKSKAAGKLASKVSSKVATQAAVKARAKAAGKVTSKINSKVATQAAGKAKSKVASKATSKKATSKIASQKAAKGSSKIAKKVVKKLASKASGKKKATSKAVAKVTSKVGGKAKKVASKATSKARGKLSGQAKAAAVGKTAAKTTGKSKVASKATSKKTSKATGKSTAKSKTKAKSKAKSKTAGRRTGRGSSS